MTRILLNTRERRGCLAGIHNVSSGLWLTTSILILVVMTLMLMLALQPANATEAITWVEDALPAGANPLANNGDTWTWVTSQKYSGTRSHVSQNLTGNHEHYFESATDTLQVGNGDTLVQWIYIPSTSVPQEIMLQWQGNGNWSYRAYWGGNLINYGTNGTASRYYMGALPSERDQWVKLEVPGERAGVRRGGHLRLGVHAVQRLHLLGLLRGGSRG